MTDTSHARLITLTTVTVSTSPGQGSLPAMTHLAAIAMLIADRDGHGGWQFSLDRRAIGAGDGEDRLLDWATSAMPERGIVIGWQLADAVVAPLLDAAREARPDIGAAFLFRLTGLVTAPTVDLAIVHGGAAAPPLAQVLASTGRALDDVTSGQMESAWAFGNTGWLARQAEAQAVAAWRLWLAEANGIAHAAEVAFETWLRSRPG